MNKNFPFALMAAFGLWLGACQKQPTDAERNAEIERQVQQRLEAEHQTEEQTKLAQRQAELDAREKALAEKENRLAATATPAVPPAATPERPAVASESEGSSYATFYRKLDPYGDWMETSDYGYVFQPRQATQSRDWRPYINGHWVYTDAGWTWISDEPFGWATYHYGRWVRLRSLGWVWVPGEQWAPAWVSWRKGNDYVGWAPLPPEAQFDRETGIRNWADSYYDIGPGQYAFVPATQFGAQVSVGVILPTERNVIIINQTTNVTNITYNNSLVVDRGPSYDDLRARSSQPIKRFRLERTNDLTNERPTFRGDVVALPAVEFRLTDRANRPPRVSRTIEQPVVERGWAGIQDQQAAQKARDKIKAEATPPPNAPSKTFVRPDGRTNPARPAPATASTPARAASPAPGKPVSPVVTPARPARPVRPETKPRPTATTSTPNETPVIAATPAQPAANRLPTLTPAPSVSAEHTASPKPTHPGEHPGADAPRAEMRMQRQQEQAQRRAEREQMMEQRQGEKRGDQNLLPRSLTERQPAASAAAPVLSSSRLTRSAATRGPPNGGATRGKVAERILILTLLRLPAPHRANELCWANA